MFNNIIAKIKEFMQVKRNKTIVTIGLIIICFFVFNLGGLLGRVFTSITSIFSSDNKEVKQVIFKSDGYDSEEDGSFKVVKQADWTSTSTAQIIFTVDSIMEADIIKKDIIVVLDTSASMNGSRLNSINNELKELFNVVLEDEGNKFALIEFNDTAKVLTDFTDNKTTLNNLLDNITPTGETNYNQALLRVGDIMSDYTRSNDREVKVIFITDGLPNVEHPNQNATYEQLKDEYPYITVYSIQCWMSSAIVPEVSRISDFQTWNYNFLRTVLGIAYSPIGYETFEIVDYIDNTYFEVEDIKDIEVSIGNVSLTTENGVQKITWTVPSGTFKTGSSHTLKIDISLKDTYVKKEGLYSTNKETNIKIKLPEQDLVEMTTTETPKLKNPYTITYVANAPDGCSATIDLTEAHYAYETVSFAGTKLSCDGYTFSGWEVDLGGITMINSEAFVMPTQDITIKGVWTKLDISKNMSGEVYEKLTLYGSIARQAVADNIASKYVTSATGINFGAISSDTNGKGVYTIASTMNDTYPIHYFRGDVENNHVVFGGFCWEIVRTTETGGVKLIYDGKPSNGKCNNTDTDSQLSTLAPFNSNAFSPAAAGYMYNTVYSHTVIDTRITKNILNKNENMSDTNYYYGTSATYNSSTGTYTLGGVVQRAWNDYYNNLNGYYTCLSISTTCSTVYYILDGYSSYSYYLALSSGNTINNSTITIGEGIVENTNGTYNLTEVTNVKKTDWYTNFANYQGYYICSDYSSTTCATAYYIHSPSNYQIVGNTTDRNYLYGKSFTYNTSTGEYALSDTTKFWKQYTEYENIGNYHYTCFDKDGICTNVYYIPTLDSTYTEYIQLSNGKSVNDALDEMLWADNVNEKDSNVKKTIDEWYENNLTNYTKYLEDTIWCNDRSIGSLGGWDPNNKLYNSGHIWFNPNITLVSNLECKNLNDRFTVNSANGNGKLTYPSSLITTEEIRYAGVNSYLHTGKAYNTLSPSAFYYRNYLYILALADDDFNLRGSYAAGNMGVRPMISLKPGITYTSGNGTEDNPYIIDLSS